MSKNTVNKLLSLGIALIMWMYVISVVNPPITRTFNDVPIEVIGLEELTERELALAGGTNFTVDIVAEGTKSLFSSLSASDFEASINVSGSELGERKCEIKITAPPGVTVSLGNPDVTVWVEDLVQVSKTVELRVTNKAEDQEEGNVSLQPSTIEVTGAKSDVEAVSKIMVHVAANRLSDTEVQTVRENAVAVDSNENRVNNVTLSSQYVDVNARLYSLKEVNLKVNLEAVAANGYEIERIEAPATVKVKGPKATLDRITQIETTPVEIMNFTTNQTVPLTVDLSRYEGVELSGDNGSIAARIYLADVLPRTFTFGSAEIETEGLDPQYYAYIDTTDIQVTVTGRTNVVEGMSKGDIRLYIDLENADTETLTAVIEASSNLAFDEISVEPGEVTVTINEAASDDDTQNGEAEEVDGDITEE